MPQFILALLAIATLEGYECTQAGLSPHSDACIQKIISEKENDYSKLND